MRSLSTTVLLAAVVLGAVACAQEQDDAPPIGSSDYLASVEALLAPPSRLASVTAERLADAERPVLDVTSFAEDARREHTEFAALPVESPVLVAQRDHLAAGYADLLATIDPLVAAHAGADTRRLAAAARPFYDALQALPAAVPPPDAP